MYRCVNSCSANKGKPKPSCRGKQVRADDIEASVKGLVHELYEGAGPYVEQLQAQLRDHLGRAAAIEDRRAVVTGRLGELDREKERVMVLFRRNHCTLAEAEAQLDEIAQQGGVLRAELDVLRARQTLVESAEQRVVDSATLLQRTQVALDELSADGWREQIKLLVPRIEVRTELLEGAERKREKTTATIHAYPGGGAVDSVVSTDGGSGTRASCTRTRLASQ
jgi:hypothetical protein